MPLIAFNIDLDTFDEKIANQIAKAIRQSSGGFQYVQAGPATLLEKNHVQVTMNILDFKKNPLYRIFETVQMEAKKYHVSIMSSEVIGLLPKDALFESLKYYMACENQDIRLIQNLSDIVEKIRLFLKLRDFSIEKVIEANIKE